MENPVYKCRVFTDCKRESPQTPSNNYNKFLNQKTEKGKKIANESEKSKKKFFGFVVYQWARISRLSGFN